MSILNRPPASPSRLNLRLLASVALIAAAAVVISLGIARLGPGTSDHRSGTMSETYAGYQWKLRSITTRSGTVEMPAAMTAGLSIWPNGDMLLNDGTNVVNAHYVAHGQHVTISGHTSTLAFYAGRDPAMLLAISAFRELSGIAKATNANVSAIGTRTIEVAVGVYKLRFERAAAMEPEGSASTTSAR